MSRDIHTPCTFLSPSRLLSARALSARCVHACVRVFENLCKPQHIDVSLNLNFAFIHSRVHCDEDDAEGRKGADNDEEEAAAVAARGEDLPGARSRSPGGGAERPGRKEAWNKVGCVQGRNRALGRARGRPLLGGLKLSGLKSLLCGFAQNAHVLGGEGAGEGECVQLPTSLTRLSLPFCALSVLPHALCMGEGAGAGMVVEGEVQGACASVVGEEREERGRVVLAALQSLVLVSLFPKP